MTAPAEPPMARYSDPLAPVYEWLVDELGTLAHVRSEAAEGSRS